MKYRRGQTAISVLLWALGILTTAGLGLNLNSMNVNSAQEDKLSTLNRETGELKTDIKYIREAVDDLRKAQGIYKIATSTR